MPKVIKSLQLGKVSSIFEHPTEDELSIINERALKTFIADELICLTVHICNNMKDKIGDVLSDNFMNQFASMAAETNLKGQLNHSEDVKETWANIFKAEVVDLDENVKEISARAYVVINEDNQKILDKIEAGSIGDISISFNGEGHPVGDMFIWDECTAAREWSLVVCPCQSGTGISKELDLNDNPAVIKDKQTPANTNGGKLMKKKDFALARLFGRIKSAPADNGSTEDVSSLIDVIRTTDPEDEVDPKDIEALLQENEQLRAEIDKLRAELNEKDAELKACKEAADEQVANAEQAAIDKALQAVIDKACPLNQTVAEDMMKSFDRSQLSLEGNEIKGLAEQEAAVLKRYEGLYGKQTSTPAVSKDLPKVSLGKRKEPDNIKKSFNDRVNAMVENN